MGIEEFSIIQKVEVMREMSAAHLTEFTVCLVLLAIPPI